MTEPTTPPAAEASRDVPIPVEVLGWYGTAAIVGAYFANSHGLLERGMAYQLLNLTGAVGVGLVCWYKRTWQPMWLEVIWAGVAISALVTGG